MRRKVYALSVLAAASLAGCGAIDGGRPIETSVGFTNFSTQFYAALRIRSHDAEEYVQTPLLAPGATFRQRFIDLMGEGCPDTLDMQVLLYRRVNDDVPIGLDPGEEVEPAPIAAGELIDVPACGVQPLETYTIVVWEAPEGTARVKLAQDTPVETALRASGMFAAPDFAWEFDGVLDELADMAPPAHLQSETISGRATLANGDGVAGIGVLIRGRFRTRLNDNDPTNDPDAGFTAPIDVTQTDANGEFSFARPPGGYRVEFFSDDFAFRPAFIDVESPLTVVQTIVEPL